MMLSRLYLDGFFKHQDRTFTFEKGLTGVVGPNESGKSLIVEAVRYALFGSKALRGQAGDYRNLHVELDFEVRGQDYTVVRKGTRVELVGIASGTRPVNEAIQRILGYDLTVFDVANVCNQGDVEKLSNMRPADRKQMVDQTVGLTVLDSVIAYCTREGNALQREAQGMEAALVEPTLPEEPGDYVPSGEIEVDSLRDEVREYHELKGALAHRPLKPKAPKKSSLPPLAEIQKGQDERRILIQSIEQVGRQRDSLALPTHSAEDLDTFEAQWDQFDLWRKRQKLLSQGEHCCPKCDHTWPVASETIPEVEETTAPELSRQSILQHQGLFENVAKRDAFDKSIFEWQEALSDRPDRSEDIKARRVHDAEVSTFEAAEAAYANFMADLATREARFMALEGVVERLATAMAQLRVAELYEMDLRRYDTAKRRYDEGFAKFQALKQRSEDLLVARGAIQDLKSRVKSHLLPSLNRVASLLLTQMTGGERYRVEIDEEFDILVDGQPILTLSGSGKAVANLAIRIALGQILTNRVFSVFLADEVDAAMDDERAAYTAEALRRLTNTVGQVIQVTHKKPETDHLIELRK